MKERVPYTMRGKTALPVLVILVVLILFSSCTLRKSLQAQLDIPVSKQLNPSKATLSTQLQCGYAIDLFTSSQNKKAGAEDSFDFLAGSSNTFYIAVSTVREQVFSLASRQCIPHKIPLYILYQKMKFWI